MTDQSLLDFLYADHERVASFLSQLLGTGSPTEAERTGGKGKTTGKKAEVDLGFFNASLEGGRNWNQEIREVYDPLWSNSRRLIDEIKNREECRSDRSPRVGQIRIFSGTLLCFDYSLINSFLSGDHVDDLLAAGFKDEDVPKNKNGPNERAVRKKLAGTLRGFLNSLPLGIGFVLVTDQAHFWFNVKRQYLSLQDLDIPLKFLTHISGTWEVLGIVDAAKDDHIAGVRPVIDRNIDGLIPPIALNFLQLTGTLTGQFGRPTEAWGMSPLAVYRDVIAG